MEIKMQLTDKSVPFRLFTYLTKQRGLLQLETYSELPPTDSCNLGAEFLWYALRIVLLIFVAIVLSFAIITPIDFIYNVVTQHSVLTTVFVFDFATPLYFIMYLIGAVIGILMGIAELYNYISRRFSSRDSEPSFVKTYISSKLNKVCVPIEWVITDDKNETIRK